MDRILSYLSVHTWAICVSVYWQSSVFSVCSYIGNVPWAYLTDYCIFYLSLIYYHCASVYGQRSVFSICQYMAVCHKCIDRFLYFLSVPYILSIISLCHAYIDRFLYFMSVHTQAMCHEYIDKCLYFLPVLIWAICHDYIDAAVYV